MKTLILLSVALLGACGLGGCKPPPRIYAERAPSAAPAPQPDPKIAAPAIVELEKRVQVEHEIRLATESRLKEQEAAKSRWQNMAMLAVTAAVVLLLVGTILGTRARHDAKK